MNAQGALDRARLQVRDCDEDRRPDTVLRAIDDLLQALSLNGNAFSMLSCADAAQTSQAMQASAAFIRDTASTHVNVRHIFLVHLASLPLPLPFIDIIPALFSAGATPQLIEDVVSQLKLVLETDHGLLLPIIGALVDLPLPPHLAPQLAELAENAISVVDESDLPMLFRTLLKSLSIINADQAAFRLRREMGSLSHPTLALVVEVMWEVLPSSPRAADVFVEQIVRENQARALSAQAPLADLAVILIVSETYELQGKAKSLLEAWLCRGVFPFKLLTLILSYRRTNEAWDRMIPAIWRVCLWLLEALSASDAPSVAGQAVFGTHAAGSNGSTLNLAHQSAKASLGSLILSLYESIPSLQESILSTLLNRCCTRGEEELDGYSISTSATSCSLPPLGGACWAVGTTARCTGESFSAHESLERLRTPRKKSRSAVTSLNTNANANTNAYASIFNRNNTSTVVWRAQALLAAKVLEVLGSRHSDVGTAILNALMSRLQPSAEGSIALPCPAITHSLLVCVTSATLSSPQAESTLLIIIQKLLAAIPQTDTCLMTLLGATRFSSTSANASSNALSRAEGGLSMSDGSSGTKRINSNSHYTTGSIGLMLAGHLLNRSHCDAKKEMNNSSSSASATVRIASADPSKLSHQDVRAVLTWTGRALGTFQDASIVYALDLFVTEMTKGLRRAAGVSYESLTLNGRNVAQTSSGAAANTRAQLVSIIASSFQRFLKTQRVAVTLPCIASSPSAPTSASLENALQSILQTQGFTTVILDVGDDQSEVSSLRALLEAQVEAENAVAQSNANKNNSGLAVDLAASPPLVWCVARLARDLVSIAEESDSFPLEQVAFRNAAVVSTGFWFLQRAAALDSLLKVEQSNSANGTTENSDSMQAIGVQLSVHPELDLDLFDTLSSSTSSSSKRRVKPVPSFVPPSHGWAWPCPSSDAFLASFVRPLGMSVSQALQLAWERGLLAAVLLGGACRIGTLEAGGEDDGQALRVVSRLLSVVNSSRYMLRAAYAGTGQKEHKPSPAKSTVRRAEVLIGGSGAAKKSSKSSSSAQSASNLEADRADAALQQAKQQHAYYAQCCGLQRLLNRLLAMLSDGHVFAALEKLLNMPHLIAPVRSTQTAFAAPAPYPLPNSNAVADEETEQAPISAGLLTDTGLAVVACCVLKALKYQEQRAVGDGFKPDSEPTFSSSSSNGDSSDNIFRQPNGSTSSYLRDSLSDVFIPLQEVRQEGDAVVGVSSEIAAFGESRRRALLGRALRLLPSLTAHVEILRRNSDAAVVFDDRATVHKGKDSSKKESSAKAASKGASKTPPQVQRAHLEFLGAPLDRQGCAILLLSLHVLLESVILRAQADAGGDIGEFARNPAIAAVCPEAFDAHLQPHQSQQSHYDADEEILASRRVVFLYASLEKQVSTLQDAALAASGLKLLAALGRGTQLSPRIAASAWGLVQSLHPVHTDVLATAAPQPAGVGRGTSSRGGSNTEESAALPGLDALWPHVACSLAATPSQELCLSELTTASGSSKLSQKSQVLLRSALAPAISSGAQNKLARGNHTISSLRVFLATFWAHDGPNRVYGLAQLLTEVFHCHLSEDVMLVSGRQVQTGKRPRAVGKSNSRGTDSSKRARKGHFYTGDDDDDEKREEDGDVDLDEIDDENEEEEDEDEDNDDISINDSVNGQREDEFQPSVLFPSMTAENVDSYLSIALSLLPALTVISQPDKSITFASPLTIASPTGGHRSAKEEQEEAAAYRSFAGPYEPTAQAARLFIWCLREMDRVAEEGAHLRLYVVISPLLIKICRAQLDAMELALQSCAAWRSRQGSVVKSDAVGGSGNTSNDSDVDAMDMDADRDKDPGSVEYLAILLDWALTVAQAVMVYAQSLKTRLLLNPSEKDPESVGKREKKMVPKGLTRAVPQLQLAAERLVARVQRMAKVYILRVREIALSKSEGKGEVDREEDNSGTSRLSSSAARASKGCMREAWVRGLQRGIKAFAKTMRLTLREPPDADYWQLTPEKGSAAAAASRHGHAWDDQDDENEGDDGGGDDGSSASYRPGDSEDGDDDSSLGRDDGFSAKPSGHGGGRGGGWGMYDANEEAGEEDAFDDDDDDDDGDDDDNDE